MIVKTRNTNNGTIEIKGKVGTTIVRTTEINNIQIHTT